MLIPWSPTYPSLSSSPHHESPVSANRASDSALKEMLRVQGPPGLWWWAHLGSSPCSIMRWAVGSRSSSRHLSASASSPVNGTNNVSPSQGCWRIKWGNVWETLRTVNSAWGLVTTSYQLRVYNIWISIIVIGFNLVEAPHVKIQ